MDLFKRPKVDDQYDVGPKVAKHFGQHGQGPLEGTGEPVLVLVDDEKGVDLLDLVTQNLHDLVDKLGVLGVLEPGSVHHRHVGTTADPPA